MVSFERVIRRRISRQSAHFKPKQKKNQRQFHHMGSTRRPVGYSNPGGYIVRHNDGVPDVNGKDITTFPGSKYTPHYGVKEAQKAVKDNRYGR